MIVTIVPQSKILQQYIAFFYVLNTHDSGNYKYFAFPHTNTGMSFIKGAIVKRHEYQVQIDTGPDWAIQIEVLGKYTCPVLVNYNCPIQEISIIFKPLGINRFLRETYHSIAPKFSQSFENTSWLQMGNSLFNTEDSVLQLEHFLLSKLEETLEISTIEKSLPIIEDLDLNYSINEIAEKIGYNLKTFQRQFTKHMGCSPIDYKRIVRFRNSIASKLNAHELKSLTDITYENNYFDQSYFIKEFKRLTNHNPKKFFKEISQVNDNKIIWEIL